MFHCPKDGQEQIRWPMEAWCNTPYISKLGDEPFFLHMKSPILWFILEYMTYNEYPSDRIAYDALSMFIWVT